MILGKLLLGFLRVGCFAFGGAYGAIPLIRDIVFANGWLDDEALTYMIAVSESTPGPIMINLATYIGSSQAGLLGAMIATTAVVLPSFLIILLVTVFLKTALKNRYIQAILRGMKPCVIGIVLETGILMTLKNCFGSNLAGDLSWQTVTIILLLIAAMFGSRYVGKRKISPILLIVLSAVAGVVLY